MGALFSRARQLEPRLKLALRLALAVIGVLCTLGLAEVTLRVVARRQPRHTARPPFAQICPPCSYLFELNPAREGISKQALRDREFTPEPPPGVFRIMVLGDSLPFGYSVSTEATFPKVLERELGQRGYKVEIMNTGVPGYSTYNELAFYLDRGRAFHPNLVLLSFCMNDVVDPTIHWSQLVDDVRKLSQFVPKEAIPNLEYHRTHSVPLAEKMYRERYGTPYRLLHQLELYKLYDVAFPSIPATSVTAGGKRYPAYLVHDDPLSMEVLTDYESTEWKWLRGLFDQLAAAVRADHATFAMLTNPLAYQLDPAYPLHPEEQFLRYCRERGIPCADALPALRARAEGELYLGKARGGVHDVWHYNSHGHAAVGKALADFLEKEKLLPAKTP